MINNSLLQNDELEEKFEDIHTTIPNSYLNNPTNQTTKLNIYHNNINPALNDFKPFDNNINENNQQKKDIKTKCHTFWCSSSRKNRTRRYCFLIFVTLSSFFAIRISQALGLLDTSAAISSFKIMDSCDVDTNTIDFNVVVELDNPSPIEATILATSGTEISTSFGKIGNLITPDLTVFGGKQDLEVQGSLRICSSCVLTLKESVQDWLNGNKLELNIAVPLAAKFPASAFGIPFEFGGVWVNISRSINTLGNNTDEVLIEYENDLEDEELLNSILLKEITKNFIEAAVGLKLITEKSKTEGSFIDVTIPSISFDAYINNGKVLSASTREFDFVPITSDKYEGIDELFIDFKATSDNLIPLQNAVGSVLNKDAIDISVQTVLPEIGKGENYCLLQKITSGIYFNLTFDLNERRVLLNNNQNNNNKQRNLQILEMTSSFFSIDSITLDSITNSSLDIKSIIDFEGLVNWKNIDVILPNVYIDIYVDELMENNNYKFAEVNLINNPTINSNNYLTDFDFTFKPLNVSQLLTVGQQFIAKETTTTLNIGFKKNTDSLLNEILSAINFDFEISAPSIDSFEQITTAAAGIAPSTTSSNTNTNTNININPTSILLNVTSDESFVGIDLIVTDIGITLLKEIYFGWDFDVNLKFFTKLIDEDDYFNLVSLYVEPFISSDINSKLHIKLLIFNKESNINYIFDILTAFSNKIPFDFKMDGNVNTNKIYVPDIKIKRITPEIDRTIIINNAGSSSISNIIDPKYITIGGITENKILNIFGGIALSIDSFQNSNFNIQIELPLLAFGLASSGECRKVKNGFTTQPPIANLVSVLINPISIFDFTTDLLEAQVGIEILSLDRIVEVGSLLIQKIEQEICLAEHPTITSTYLGKFIANLAPSFILSSNNNNNNDDEEEDEQIDEQIENNEEEDDTFNLITNVDLSSNDTNFCISTSVLLSELTTSFLIGWDEFDLSFKTISTDIGFFNLKLDYGFIGVLDIENINDLQYLSVPNFYTNNNNLNVDITLCFYTEDELGGESSIIESATIAREFFENILQGDSKSYQLIGSVGNSWSKTINNNEFNNVALMPGAVLKTLTTSNFFDNYGKTSTPSIGPSPTVAPTIFQSKAPTFVIPDEWTCPDSWWYDSICDCNCGAQDPKCITKPYPVVGCTGSQLCINGVCKNSDTKTPTSSPTSPTFPGIDDNDDSFININGIVLKDVNMNNGFDLSFSVSFGSFNIEINLPQFSFLIYSPLSKDVVQISIEDDFVLNKDINNPPINAAINVLSWQNLVLLANEIKVNESEYINYAFVGPITESTQSITPINGLNFFSRIIPNFAIDLSNIFNSTHDAIEQRLKSINDDEEEPKITYVTEFDLEGQLSSTLSESFIKTNLTVLYDQNMLNKITIENDLNFEMFINNDNNGFGELNIKKISFGNDINIQFIDFLVLKLFGNANELVYDIFNDNDINIKITGNNNFVIDMIIPKTLLQSKTQTIQEVEDDDEEKENIDTSKFLDLQSIHILGGNNPGDNIVFPCILYGYCGEDDLKDDNLDFINTIDNDIYTEMDGLTIGILADIITKNNDNQVGVDLINWKVSIDCDLYARFGFIDNYIGAAKLHKGLIISNDPELQTKLKFMLTFNLYEETVGETRNLIYMMMNGADTVLQISGNEDKNGSSNFISNAIISIKQDIDISGQIQNLTSDFINQDEEIGASSSLLSLFNLDLTETKKTSLKMNLGMPLNYTGFDIVLGNLDVLIKYTDDLLDVANVKYISNDVLRASPSDEEQEFLFEIELFYADGNEIQREAMENFLANLLWSKTLALNLELTIIPTTEFYNPNEIDVLDNDKEFKFYLDLTLPEKVIDLTIIDSFEIDLGGTLVNTLTGFLDITAVASAIMKNTLPFPVLISYFQIELWMSDNDGIRTGGCNIAQDTGLLNGFTYLNPCSLNLLFSEFCNSPITPYGTTKNVKGTNGGPITSGNPNSAVDSALKDIETGDPVEILELGKMAVLDLEIDATDEMAGRLWDNFYNTKQICADMNDGLVHVGLRADIDGCSDTSSTSNADLQCTTLVRIPIDLQGLALIDGTTCGRYAEVTNLEGFSGMQSHPDFPNTIPTTSFDLIENSGSGARWETNDKINLNDNFQIKFDVTYSGSGEGEAFGLVFTNVQPTSTTEPKPDNIQGTYASGGLPDDTVVLAFTYQGCNVFGVIKNHQTDPLELLANSESLVGDEIGKSGYTQTYTVTYSSSIKMMHVQLDQTVGSDSQRVHDFDLDLSKELNGDDYAWFGFTGNYAGSDETQVTINNYQVFIDGTDSESLTIAPDYFLPISNVNEEGEIIFVARSVEGRLRGYGDNTMDIKFYLVNDVNVEIIPSLLTITNIDETGYYKAKYKLNQRGRYVVKASCISSNCINQNTYSIITTRLFVSD